MLIFDFSQSWGSTSWRQWPLYQRQWRRNAIGATLWLCLMRNCEMNIWDDVWIVALFMYQSFLLGILASLHHICALCSSLSETPSSLSWFVYSCVNHSWGCFSKAKKPTGHVRSRKLMCMLSFPILLQTASELPCCIFYHLLSVLLACPLIINMCMLW
jgi:hypothetical protein